MPIEEVVYTDTPKVSCEGSQGALGHPLVYLNMAGKNEIMCPYCSKRFVLQKKEIH